MQQPKKAQLWVDGRDQPLEVQYNPTEFSLDKGVQIAEIAIPGLDSPLLQFVRGQNEKMTLDLFFDTTESGMGNRATSVTTLTDPFYELVKIVPKTHAPPICLFCWSDKFTGSNFSAHAENQGRNGFRCVVESVKQKFTLFSPEGVPLRATLTVTLREYKTLSEQVAQLNLHSPDRTQSHIIQRGETLSSVAAQHDLEPGEWRHIADAKEIEDPRRITVGTFLTIPPIR